MMMLGKMHDYIQQKIIREIAWCAEGTNSRQTRWSYSKCSSMRSTALGLRGVILHENDLGWLMKR